MGFGHTTAWTTNGAPILTMVKAYASPGTVVRCDAPRTAGRRAHCDRRNRHRRRVCGSSTPSGTTPAAGPARASRIGLQRIGAFSQPVYLAAALGNPHPLFVVERPA